MKEEQTTPDVQLDLGGETDAYGEGFPEPAVELVDGQHAQDEQQERAEANERAAMLAVLTPMVNMACNVFVARMEGAEPVSELEAGMLADRIWAVAEYYDLQLSDAWALWFGLAATAGGIFGPRVMAARRHAQEKARYENQGIEGGQDSASDRPEGVRENDPAESPPGDGSESQSETAGVYP